MEDQLKQSTHQHQLEELDALQKTVGKTIGHVKNC